jgi:hypothetical protein
VGEVVDLLPLTVALYLPVINLLPLPVDVELDSHRRERIVMLGVVGLPTGQLGDRYERAPHRVFAVGVVNLLVAFDALFVADVLHIGMNVAKRAVVEQSRIGRTAGVSVNRMRVRVPWPKKHPPADTGGGDSHQEDRDCSREMRRPSSRRLACAWWFGGSVGA